ncbi:hypothetical protein EG328_003347 [Venturia inaequalis]|uniref:Uncharacterized protein n=1 Tax=Venturia inaequalis TaxID=5025 RepID=A0A8H3VHR7_VENIN|nr:hypothetical protein EG328_003347 [Venturia inaequalis]
MGVIYVLEARKIIRKDAGDEASKLEAKAKKIRADAYQKENALFIKMAHASVKAYKQNEAMHKDWSKKKTLIHRDLINYFKLRAKAEKLRWEGHWRALKVAAKAYQKRETVRARLAAKATAAALKMAQKEAKKVVKQEPQSEVIIIE